MTAGVVYYPQSISSKLLWCGNGQFDSPFVDLFRTATGTSIAMLVYKMVYKYSTVYAVYIEYIDSSGLYPFPRLVLRIYFGFYIHSPFANQRVLYTHVFDNLLFKQCRDMDWDNDMFWWLKWCDRNLVVRVIAGIFDLGCHNALAGPYEPTRSSGKWDRSFTVIHELSEYHNLSN